MKAIQVLILVFVLCGIVLVGAQVAVRYLRKPVAQQRGPSAPIPRVPRSQNPPGQNDGKNGVNPAPKENIPPTPKSQIGQIRFAEDAVHKQGDFWLEQEFELIGAAKRDGKRFVKLFAGLDEKTLRGISVTISGWQAVLELDEGKGGAKRELAKAKLPQFPAGRYDLGILWRGGELSAWVGPVEVLEYCPPDRAATTEMLKLDSAVQVLSEDVGLGARRALAFNAIRFDDNFMRTVVNDDWRPLAGRWELTSMAFAERSANPFSLRCVFNDTKPFEDPIYGGERRTRGEDSGLGVQLSSSEGTPHIVRITGGSPAAHAGLAEDDIFIEVNGRAVGPSDTGTLYRQIYHSAGELRLKMYRPGERMFREYNIMRDAFKWGVSVESQPIAPLLEPNKRGEDAFAFVTAGEAGWSDYEVEVAAKPLGSGGFGMAVAALSENDCVLFRWRGPRARGETAGGKTDMLQLIRVKNGQETVLAEKPGRYRAYEFYRMGINWSGDKISCMLDKNEIFSARIADIKRGKIGLYALKGDPVFFDDLHVAGDRAVTSSWHTAERSLNSIFALEDDMEVWANPALEWERDLKTGWSIHNQRFPGEQSISIAKPRFKELEVALYAGEDPTAIGCPRLTVRNGVAEISGDGIMKQKVTVGAGPFQHVAVESGIFGVRAAIDGKKLGAEWDGAKPHFGMPGVKASGERVAILGLKNLGEPSAVRVTSTGTMEYTFDNAPSDWKVMSGRWGLLNKWICDPRWSWFGGRTKTIGAIWNKHVFSGDISVDAHVAMLMVRDDPPYERTGDHNITICGDGINTDSGYTLIFGGDINSWTRLYRKGVLVAEATKEDFRVFSDRIRHPDKPQLHQRWFHLKLEKIGNAVSFYRDGMLAFKYVDPEPLKEGRVGFWTLDNSFLLSRVRIAHGGARPAPFEDNKSGLFEDAKAINMFDGETPTAVAREELPKAVAESLATPPNAFQAAVSDALPNANPPAADELDAKAPTAAKAYRVTNGIGGGPFALQFKSRLIEIEREGVLRFAYRIEPDAKVDLYLVGVRDGDFNPRHQNCYRWRMNGPKEDTGGTLSDEFSPLIGDVPGVVADGKWHTVQFDLQPSWRDFWRKRGYMHAARFSLRPMFGNLCNVGYGLGGMNGNHAGASYSATEVRSMTPAEVSAGAPSVARVVWPFDAEGDGRSVAVYFDAPGGSGIAPETLNMSLNGTHLPTENMQAAGPLSFNAVQQCLRADVPKLLGAQLELKEGDKLTLKIEAQFSNRTGIVSATGFASEWAYNAEAARKANKPVEAPGIVFWRGQTMELKPGDAALRLSEVGAVDTSSTRIQASTEAPPWAPLGQKRSVEVIATGELPAMGFQMRGVRYNLQNWPYLEMEYKVPVDAPFNLHLVDENGSTHSLLLVDVEDGRDQMAGDIASRFGPPADFVADGTWRRSTVPLLKLFSDANQGAPGPQLTTFSLHDHGWRGGRRGLHYWIHRIQPVPAGRAQDITIGWSAADVAGIADVESSVDDSPLGDPSGKHELVISKTLAHSLEKSGKRLKDGWNYVHVRAKNGAGVWSGVSHRKFFLDTTPPRIVKTEPADGGTLHSQTIRIYLDEEHGVNIDSLTMNVDGVDVRAEYDAKANVLQFNALTTAVRFTRGTKSKVEIRGLADRLGNVQATPYTFSFDCDAAPGKPGPEMATLTYAASTEHSGSYRQYEMELSYGLNFEEHFGHVHAMRDCRMEWLDDAALASEGKRAVRFTCLQDDGDPQIMLHKNAWFIDRLPLLHFDYKAEPGFKADLQIEVFGVWYSVRFTGTGHAPNEGKAIGAFAGIVPDGTWRHASVDLRALLDAARVRMPERIVNKIVFSANGEDGCVRGATLSIDNLDLTPPAGGLWRGGVNGTLKWAAKKTPAEVLGYSIVMDQDATTIPPPRMTDRGEAASMRARQGIWYVHARACDQAGNWGPDKTIRLDFGEAATRLGRVFDDDN